MAAIDDDIQMKEIVSELKKTTSDKLAPVVSQSPFKFP